MAEPDDEPDRYLSFSTWWLEGEGCGGRFRGAGKHIIVLAEDASFRIAFKVAEKIARVIGREWLLPEALRRRGESVTWFLCGLFQGRARGDERDKKTRERRL